MLQGLPFNLHLQIGTKIKKTLVKTYIYNLFFKQKIYSYYIC